MLKPMHILCVSLCAFSMGVLQADQPGLESDAEFFPSFSTETISSVSAEDHAPAHATQALAAPAKREKSAANFKPFTGKIRGKKVRLRSQPDLDSSIVKELQKDEFLHIVGECDDFWITTAPSDLKAYVFRSFVLDNVVEGNRVNVRLYPSLEAPVIMHLNSGDPVEGVISSLNHKWLEISAPEDARFYISKSFIENVGGPEVKLSHEKRERLALKQLAKAKLFADEEMRKSYNEIDFDTMNHNFQVVLLEYGEFPQYIEQAKNELSTLQEKFIDKRISYMENKAEQEEENLAIRSDLNQELSKGSRLPTDKMKLWDPVEEALFLSWSSMNDEKGLEDYQMEQRLAAEQISGILEAYQSPVKNRPGDYILRKNSLPVGYIYSTTVNLQDYVGKQISITGSTRPNNNFAFPAYYALDVEE